jgi:hypothetical protein
LRPDERETTLASTGLIEVFMKHAVLLPAAAIVVTVAMTVGAQAKIITGKTFSFSYPALPSLSVSNAPASPNDWSKGSTVPGKVLAIATLSAAFAPKTNFAGAVFTVAASADPKAVASCLTTPENTSAVRGAATINGVAFAKFVSGDAGAGNLHEIHSYRAVHNNQCYAVEYDVHSLNIGNYDPSSGIVAFDKSKVQKVLNGMLLSFKFL